MDKSKIKASKADALIVDIILILKSQQLFHISMDFQTLQLSLPKKPQQWSIDDTCKWLQFINLPQLALPFKTNGIDGSCLHLLDEEILRHELNINSSIIRKKLMNWIKTGLDGYSEHLIKNQSKIQPQLLLRGPQLHKAPTTCIRPESRPKILTHQPDNTADTETYLVLEQFEGNSVGFHVIKNQTMSIGFGKNNHIHSLETSISERHALVGRKNNGYFIQDLGSKFGTFVKVNQRTLLRNNMLLEIGSYQFLVSNVDTHAQTLRLKQVLCTEPESEDENINKSNNMQQGKMLKNKGNVVLNVDLKSRPKFTFGRRKENDFQRDDKHMSGMHSKITYFNGSFYIEDYGSTNGTWIRISAESLVSPEVPIEHESIIKLGTAITYICKVHQGAKPGRKPIEQQSEMVDENMCRICKKQENNCLFFPCSHNICCIGCSSKVGTYCPECSQQIGEKIKIHK